jgi:hypothetical protein
MRPNWRVRRFWSWVQTTRARTRVRGCGSFVCGRASEPRHKSHERLRLLSVHRRDARNPLTIKLALVIKTSSSLAIGSSPSPSLTDTHVKKPSNAIQKKTAFLVCSYSGWNSSAAPTEQALAIHTAPALSTEVNRYICQLKEWKNDQKSDKLGSLCSETNGVARRRSGRWEFRPLTAFLLYRGLVSFGLSEVRRFTSYSCSSVSAEKRPIGTDGDWNI